MPAGRPRSPAGAARSAPVLSIRLDAEVEGALNVVRHELGQIPARAAVQAALREVALRLAGPERLRHAIEVLVRKRRRADDSR